MSKQTKIIWNYDPLTLALLDISELDESDLSPLEKGVWLIPAHATDVKPPKAKKNEVPVFNPDAGVWSVVPDFRDAVLYDKATGLLAPALPLGVSPDDTVTDLAPPDGLVRWGKNGWEPDTDAIKAARAKDINQERAERLAAGVKHDGQTFPCDDTFMNELRGMLQDYQLSLIDGEHAVRTLDNQTLVLGRDAIAELAKVVGIRRRELYVSSWAEKDAL